MRLVLSEGFKDILLKMDNEVSRKLLNIRDVETNYNYIDITETKDLVSFTPNNKVKELLGNRTQLYCLDQNQDRRCLTHSDKNNHIFDKLGYDKSKGDMWAIEISDKAKILKEVISESSRTYVLIQKISENESMNQFAVINKSCLLPLKENKIWNLSRNNLKIGRLARAILSDAKVDFLAKDVEIFTNQFKATFDFTKDILRQFDIVEGDKIVHWYNKDNYESGSGILNNSCMCQVPGEYLDIYSKNKQVKLLILYGDNGILRDSGKYDSNKIKGRAILWDAKIDGKIVQFMDRVYTKCDSDVDLFIKYAQKNKWWYKSHQSMYPAIELTDGKSIFPKELKIEVTLDNLDFDKYPYMDTLCFGKKSKDSVYLTNNEDVKEAMMFRRTDGEWRWYNSNQN